MHELLLILTSK